MKEVGVELCFGSLETLSIREMEEWEKWCFSDDVNEEASVIFPKLRKLTIINCSKLVGNCLSIFHLFKNSMLKGAKGLLCVICVISPLLQS